MVGTQDLKKPLLLLVAFLPLVTYAQPLRTRLDALLRDPLFRTTDVALAVYDLTADTLLYRHREAKRMRPASTQKIITTVTALALLGPDYTYCTTLRLDSLGTAETSDSLARAIPYYTIKGDLDPLFTEADLDSLLHGLPDRHVLHTDLTLMDAPYWGPGWSWDDAPYTFQPRLSALMIDEGCVTVTVRPTAVDSLAAVTVTPASGYYTVVNRTRSKQPAAGPFALRQNWMQDGRTLVLEGNVEKTIQKTVPMNSEAFAKSLIEEKTKSDQHHHGNENNYELCIMNYALKTPLPQILSRALKKSDNLCAEALYFHLTPQDERPATWESSARTVQTFARDTLRLTPEEVDVHDGSGVSLYDYTTATALLTYLRYAHRQPWFPTFYDALPIAGRDGTLIARMRGTRAAGNVHAKTGSVTGVSTLAGYVTAANGHLLAFVVMNQGVPRLADARRWQDKVCEELAR